MLRAKHTSDDIAQPASFAEQYTNCKSRDQYFMCSFLVLFRLENPEQILTRHLILF